MGETKYPDAYANARLIAAAPELLEACRALFCLIVAPGNYSEDHRQTMLTAARGAIARADKGADPC